MKNKKSKLGKHRLQQRAYYLRHRKEQIERVKSYYKKNKDKILKKQKSLSKRKIYYNKNKNRLYANKRKYITFAEEIIRLLITLDLVSIVPKNCRRF